MHGDQQHVIQVSQSVLQNLGYTVEAPQGSGNEQRLEGKSWINAVSVRVASNGSGDPTVYNRRVDIILER